MWLLLLFIAVPLIEIALFIQVGGWLTLWPTLAIVLATGIIGTVLVKQQGLRVLNDLRSSLQDMRDPLSPLAHGAMILFAGALLLTPGFFTDAVGFLLLVPAVRRLVVRSLAARVSATGFTAQHPSRQGPDSGAIDADYTDVTGPQPQNQKPGQKPSGWTEH